MQIFLLDEPHQRTSIDLFRNIRGEQSQNLSFLNELQQFINNIDVESDEISQYDLMDNYEIYKENKLSHNTQSLDEIDQQNKQQYKNKILKYQNKYIYELMDQNKIEREQITQLIQYYNDQSPFMISFMPILFGLGINQMPDFKDLQSLQQIKVDEQELINLSPKILDQFCQSLNKYLKLIQKDISLTTRLEFNENLNQIYIFEQENRYGAKIYGYCTITNSKVIKISKNKWSEISEQQFNRIVNGVNRYVIPQDYQGTNTESFLKALLNEIFVNVERVWEVLLCCLQEQPDYFLIDELLYFNQKI